MDGSQPGGVRDAQGQNGKTSSRHKAQIHLESHVHGKRACVVWGRADEKGPSHRYLVSRLFHSATPRRPLPFLSRKQSDAAIGQKITTICFFGRHWGRCS